MTEHMAENQPPNKPDPEPLPLTAHGDGARGAQPSSEERLPRPERHQADHSKAEKFFESFVIPAEDATSESISKYLTSVHETYSENINYARVGYRMFNEVIPGFKNSDLPPEKKSEKINEVKTAYRNEIVYYMFIHDHPNPFLLTIPYSAILKHHDKIQDILDVYRTKFWTFNLGHNMKPRQKNRDD